MPECSKYKVSAEIRLENFENRIDLFIVVDVQRDRFGEVQTEDSHDGLRIDDVTAGHQVKVGTEFGDVVDEVFNLIDGIQCDCNRLHDE